MAGRLEGKVALITGTGGGQGRAAALRFAAEGATVVGTDLNDIAGSETVELVTEAGGRMIGGGSVDLGDPEQATSWVEAAAEQTGRIDVLYNNASAPKFAPFGEMTLDQWRFTVRNELDLVFHVTRAAWSHLVAARGVIINVASTAAHKGTRGNGGVAHCATKGAVLAMTRQLAVEGAAYGIRAVSISPGIVATPGTADIFADEEVLTHLLAGNLVPRVGKPADIVGLAVFLASDEAAYITGTDFLVDGGRTAL